MLFRIWLLRDTLCRKMQKNLVPGQDLLYLPATGGSEQRFLLSVGTLAISTVFFGISLSDVLKTGHETHASFSSTLQSAQPHSLHARLVHLLWTSDEIEPTCKSSTHQWKHKSFYFAIEVGGKMISVTNNSTSRTCWPEPNISWRAGKYSPCQHLLANFNQVITTQGLPRL